jgi:hypothetical protein
VCASASELNSIDIFFNPSSGAAAQATFLALLCKKSNFNQQQLSADGYQFPATAEGTVFYIKPARPPSKIWLESNNKVCDIQLLLCYFFCWVAKQKKHVYHRL